ncbi:transporter [Malacoplasma penetrans]|uniref:Predicted transporter n=1 Tax=Malacoplasma penetrans (strain HF-2) TaxID=272633 RepID=Q8EWT0_MALP2|nr:transporter [Malacoplasma penetrans]BAC43913.1 predicted transporter [Malacoplasma penetrans HF-2]
MNNINQNTLEIIINLIIFVIVFSMSLFFIFRLKNVTKGYKIFFVSYVLFWIPLKMLREYTSVVQNNIDSSIVWLPLMVYGLIGVFIRPFVDYLSLSLKNRKIILYGAVVAGIISFIPMTITQNTVTNTIQSIGVGVGASMIGTYELMFKEQYTRNRSFLTVSIMAFPPLLADFIGAPIQSIIKVSAISSANNNSYLFYLSIMWMLAIVVFIGVFVILYTVKEDRNLVGFLGNNNKIEKTKSQMTFFVILCLVGFLIAFIKFSNSGSIATLTIEHLAANQGISNQISSIQGYIASLFSLFQLLGTICLSWFLIKKNNKMLAFTVGIILWIVFELVISFNTNPYVYFGVSALNGFAYGILYNLVLAYVLTLSFDNKKLKNGKYELRKISPMGIYQSILAIGIASSSFFTSYLKQALKTDNNYMVVNLSILAFIVALEIMYFVVYVLDKKTISKNKFVIKDAVSSK